MKGRQERLAVIVILYFSIVIFQHGADCPTNTVLVVNDEYHGWFAATEGFCGACRTRLNGSPRQW